MSWMQKLYETYEQCKATACVLDIASSLEPICHTSQLAHIEVSITSDGTFLRANVIPKQQGVTLIPCTEASVGRTGNKPINHPLCDKLQYLAGDFVQYGGRVTTGFAKNPAEPHELYLQLLRRWVGSDFSHAKIMAILTYLQRGDLIADLVREKLLPIAQIDGKPHLLQAWNGAKSETPAIFKVMVKGSSPADAFIRWRIEVPGELFPETWKDASLITAWIDFYLNENTQTGFCLATGETAMLASNHAAKLLRGADKAKLISANDTTGFTFRGRFDSAEQACSVGFEISQKAHNALRWLIRRQGFQAAKQVVVAWAVSGKRLPDPFADSFALLDEADGDGLREQGGGVGASEQIVEPMLMGSADAGQEFGLKLKKLMAGYLIEIGSCNEIVVMGLEAATTGRIAITYYREFDFPEFIERIETWHWRHAWHQNFSKEKKFVGAPAPKDIAEACFGAWEKEKLHLDEKLVMATVERLLPCIMDGVAVPYDLMAKAVCRASNRMGIAHLVWEKYLGIACALFKGQHIERNYQMALELDRISRDYLYGRLLALADNIENFALEKAQEKRDTTAARLMQRFADHPCQTWRNIELALIPYKTRLRSNSAGFLRSREMLLDEVMSMFQKDDFSREGKLSGEFLLGYHCQRQALLNKADPPLVATENI